MMIGQYVGVFVIGMAVGFLGGLFGKGGSAIATPLLSFIGVPGFVAVAAPLPATVPGTLIASLKYWKSHLLDGQVVKWSLLFGFPATVVGSFLTKYTGAAPLLIVTALLVLGFGLQFLLAPGERETTPEAPSDAVDKRPPFWRLRLTLIAVFVGLVSGLLANSGGFLLAPAYARILHLPIKKAFACSLAVSIFLALPGTAVHMYLGHIHWLITLVLALGSVPFSYLGAWVAINSSGRRLEFWYGVALTFIGGFFLLKMFW